MVLLFSHLSKSNPIQSNPKIYPYPTATVKAIKNEPPANIMNAAQVSNSNDDDRRLSLDHLPTPSRKKQRTKEHKRRDKSSLDKAKQRRKSENSQQEERRRQLNGSKKFKKKQKKTLRQVEKLGASSIDRDHPAIVRDENVPINNLCIFDKSNMQQVTPNSEGRSSANTTAPLALALALALTLTLEHIL